MNDALASAALRTSADLMTSAVVRESFGSIVMSFTRATVVDYSQRVNPR